MYETFKCNECDRLKRQVAEKEIEIEAYKNSIKIRRNADQVWIGNFGEVRYECF